MDPPDPQDATAELAVYASEHDVDLGEYLDAIESFRDADDFGPVKDAFAACVLRELRAGQPIDVALHTARAGLPPAPA
jgi:hypothetical protein